MAVDDDITVVVLTDQTQVGFGFQIPGPTGPAGPAGAPGSGAEELYAKQVDETADGSTIYIGEAAAGSATSSAVWRIRRIVFTSVDGDDVSTLWAGGTADFDKAWDNRLSETYS